MKITVTHNDEAVTETTTKDPTAAGEAVAAAMRQISRSALIEGSWTVRVDVTKDDEAAIAATRAARPTFPQPMRPPQPAATK